MLDRGKMAVMRSTELQPPYLASGVGHTKLRTVTKLWVRRSVVWNLAEAKNLSLLLRIHISPGPRQLCPFCKDARLYGEEDLARLLTPKLEDHTLSAVRDCLYPPCWRPSLHQQTVDAPCHGAPLLRPSMYGAEERCIERFGGEN